MIKTKNKNTKKYKKGATPPDWMPERSKGEDLRSSVFALAGSSPAPVIFYLKYFTLILSYNIYSFLIILPISHLPLLLDYMVYREI